MESTMPKTLLSLSAIAMISGLIFANGANAYNRNVDIANNSDLSIMKFQASNVGDSTWGPDLLGSFTLDPGESIDINLDDRTGYCRFDFRTVMEDGSILVRPGVNVCAVRRYIVTD